MRIGVILLFVAAAVGSSAQMKPLRFRVVDEKNHPVREASVAGQWGVDQNRWVAYNGVLTDREGRAAKDFYLNPNGGNFLAWDKDQKRCGMTVVNPKDADKEVVIRLGAPACIKLAGHSIAENRAIPLSGVLIDERGMVYSQISLIESGWLSIPAGKGFVSVNSNDHAGKRVDLNLQPNESKDLGKINLDWNPSKKLEGQPAPELVFEDQKNLPAGFKLSDYKGSWVILEFWGWWCGPCVGRGVPSAIALHDIAARDGLPIKILGIHEFEANTVAEVDAKLPEIKNQHWNGRDLPFGWVVDADRSIADTFGVRGYPTTILIDPQGRVVGQRHGRGLSEPIDVLSAAQRLEWTLAEPLPMLYADCTLDGMLSMDLFGFDIEIGQSAEGVLSKFGSRKFGSYALQGSKGSALNLILEGTGLCWRTEGGKVRIESGTQADWKSPFAPSRERDFARILSAHPSFEFNGTLAELTTYLGERTDPSPVLRPADVFAGRIDPDRKINFKTTGGTLWDELTTLLEPLGLRLSIRHESLIIEAVKAR